ncbi:ATP-binding cassette domain-containing protein [Natrinema gari]|uniref:Oligopeptide/dipeptide ABC transporter, ATPase subunit n=1 Tax=Natrinema gari JCM 14663 TaxID=1230459 RepID=L9YZW8_9EURY|nr:ATP-binding cassette domain-containing protein [Natrinema gari]ELY78468.1 oligopeptide/dipeptide ABC transporter, ATPase subunit [Natrinema gari JCM 14663]
MTEPLLDVDDLQVRFDTGSRTVRAIDGLSLSVGSGEIVGLVGESGCGKSAAIRAIAGLHGPTPAFRALSRSMTPTFGHSPTTAFCGFARRDSRRSFRTRRRP